MSELSNVVFYFLSTVAQVYATILGFFIVGQIYIYGVKQKAKEWNEAHGVIQTKEGYEARRKSPNDKVPCIKIVITKPVKKIYKLLLAIILISILGIFLNIESIFEKGILVIPVIVLVLASWTIIKLYDYLLNLEKYMN